MCFNPCRYLHEPLWPLPAGATVAGWDSHPPGKRAFSRRTEKSGLDGGPSLVESCFAEAKALGDGVGDLLHDCHDEWLDRADVDPATLEGFLEHRVNTLESLAQKDHWLGVASQNPGGQYVLTIG